MPNSNVSNESEATQTSNQTILKKQDDKKHHLMIPYQGGKGEQVIKSVRKTIKRLLPSNIKVQVSFTGNKFSSCFNITDKTKLSTDMMQFILGYVLKHRLMIITLVKQNDEFSGGLKTITAETSILTY